VTKRAAMLMAAGLVAALAVGAMALSFGLTGNGPVQAEMKDQKPIVRTVHRTVTVEKPAKKAQEPVQVIQLASSPAPSTTSGGDLEGGGGFEDDGFESESEDHGEHEAGHEAGHEDSGQDD